MSVTVFRNARVVDPSRGIDETGTVVVEGRTIAAAGAAAHNQGLPEGATVVECAGKTILPGLVDARVHIGEPGGEHRETIASASVAAATGGVKDATLMLQKEVADRLLAGPGSKEYGVLSILAGLHADITRLLALPPGAFRPAPRVSSAVIRLAFRPPSVAVADETVFTRMVRTVFTQRRKTLNNALRSFAEGAGTTAAAALARADIDSRRRPETLQLVELARLADVFASADPASVL